MGILDSIFGKKKKDSATPKVKVEPNANEYQMPVISADRQENLLKYADNGHPIVISGGDFNSKTVIVVSKPSKHPNHTDLWDSTKISFLQVADSLTGVGDRRGSSAGTRVDLRVRTAVVS